MVSKLEKRAKMVGWLVLLVTLVSMWAGRIKCPSCAASPAYNGALFAVTLIFLLLLVGAAIDKRLRKSETTVATSGKPRNLENEAHAEFVARIRIIRFACRVVVLAGGAVLLFCDVPELAMARLYGARYVVLTYWGPTTMALVTFWIAAGLKLVRMLTIRLARGNPVLWANSDREIAWPRRMAVTGTIATASIALGLFLGLGYYGAISQRGIAVRDGWGAPEVMRTWRDVCGVEPHSEIMRRRGIALGLETAYRVVFKDGAIWDPDLGRSEDAKNYAAAAGNFMAEHFKRYIQTPRQTTRSQGAN